MKRVKKRILQGIVLFLTLVGVCFGKNPVTVQAAEGIPLHEIVLNKNVLEFREQDPGELLMVGFVPNRYPDQQEFQELFQNLGWFSSDERVARVMPDGMVTPVGAGHTYITIVHKSTGVSAMCEVYVSHNPGPEATCTEPQVCLTCHEIINPPTHDYESTYTTDVEPTCGTAGEKSRHCINYEECKARTDVQEISATGSHTYTDTVIAPTDKAQGYTLHSCTTCKSSYKDNYTPALGKKGEVQGEEKVNDQPNNQEKEQGQPTAPVVGPKVGKTYVKGSLKYKILSAAAGMEAQVIGAKSKKITSLKVPDVVTIQGKKLKVTSIGNKAFKKYTKLKKVVVGKNVTKIGTSAFEGCTAVNKLTLGKGVKSVGTRAFYNCKKLKNIVIQSKRLKTVGKNAFGKTANKAVVKGPAAKVKSYKKMLRRKGFSKTVQFKKV